VVKKTFISVLTKTKRSINRLSEPIPNTI